MLVNGTLGQRIRAIHGKTVGNLSLTPGNTGVITGFRGMSLIDIHWDFPLCTTGGHEYWDSCVYAGEIELFTGLDQMLELL